MRKARAIAWVLFGLFLSTCVAQSIVSDKDMIEYDRRLATHYKADFPAAGVIPDSDTAKAIAMAVAIPIWARKPSDLNFRSGLV
jgi:hypothetical protein